MAVSYKKAARYLAVCESQLTRDDLNPAYRERLEQLSKRYRGMLEGRCRRCGRTLTDPESVSLRIGPECRKVAS